ncbi:MAG: hypothetical protein RIF41_09950 [Polyangiaceae bacterium]
MTDDRNDPAIRKGALLLSSLVLTPREGLEAYRDRRVANKDVDLELLEKARAVLDAVGFILRSESAADWRKLERAHEALRGVPAPSDADDAEEAAAEGSAAPPAADRAREDTAWSAPTERAVVPPGVTSTESTEPPARAPVVPPPPLVAPPPAPAAPAPAPVAPPPAPIAPPPAPVAAHPPAVVPAEPVEAMDSTAVVAALEEGITLPFEAVDVAEPPAPVADGLPPQTSNIDETAALGVALDLGDVLPFGKDDAPSTEFTIEQYASLCAERDLVGQANVGRVLERYGLPGPDALRALDVAWTQRLHDPGRRARFDQLRARYRQWLEQPRRG